MELGGVGKALLAGCADTYRQELLQGGKVLQLSAGLSAASASALRSLSTKISYVTLKIDCAIWIFWYITASMICFQRAPNARAS